MTVAELTATWRADAATLRRCQAESQAALLERCAREVEEAIVAQDQEALDVRSAAAESGYSESQIRRLFPRQKRIPRARLPRKPGRPDSGPVLEELVSRIRSRVS